MKAQVLLPKIFNFPFTYNTDFKTQIGDLVEVLFGSSKEIGVVLENNYLEPKKLKSKILIKKLTIVLIKN